MIDQTKIGRKPGSNYKSSTEEPPAPVYADKGNLLTYIDSSGEERVVTRTEEWLVRRNHILANMQKVMGPLPDATFRVPLELEVVRVDRVRKLYSQAHSL